MNDVVLTESKLPSYVDAQCGTVNADNQQVEGKLNVDGSQCARDASRAITNEDLTVEVLTCGHHVDKVKEQLAKSLRA